jgi:pantoate--beta-alanine ligase
MPMNLTPLASTIAETRQAVASARSLGQKIGFVPTMGALHEGHASLIRAARSESEYVVVSIFVNPTQFGPNEDYARYPRTLEADRLLCAQSGASLVFCPAPQEMYPAGFVTFVEVSQLDKYLCGPRRPGHFRGVATVVLKLFNIVLPDVAYFGQKDAQQARIIQQMVRDLDVPVRVKVEPTLREADGLAMSSRNRYLDPTQRTQASVLFRALTEVEKNYRAGEREVTKLEAIMTTMIAAIPGARLDYATIVDAENLQPITIVTRPALVAMAVFLGTTRLIDNITLSE